MTYQATYETMQTDGTRRAAGERFPTTRGWPLIGSVPALMRGSTDYFVQARERYGDIYTLNLGLSKFVVLNHPRHVQHVLRDNAANYVKDGPIWSATRKVLGNGLVMSGGDFWLRQRRMMQPQFHRRRLAALGNLMTDAIEEILSSWSVPNRSMDMAQAFNQLTMRVIVRTMFGSSLATQQMNDVAQAITLALDYMLRVAVTDALPRWLPDPGRRKFAQAIAIFDEAVYAIIDKQRRGEGEENHLLAMLLDVVDAETGEGMTDRQLRDEVATIFLAGFETTAIALAWSTHYLAQHPAIQQRVTAEVDAALGGRTPTFDDLPQLGYTKQVLQETMRLRPPTWFLPRLALEDDEIDGYHIAAGTEVASLFYVIHRHPDEWAEPERFDPDRFTKERIDARHRFAWVPFGAGQRMCIGREFALMEAQMALAMMMQRYQPSAIPGYAPKLKLSSTLKTSNGICVNMARR